MVVARGLDLGLGLPFVGSSIAGIVLTLLLSGFLTLLLCIAFGTVTVALPLLLLLLALVVAADGDGGAAACWQQAT